MLKFILILLAVIIVGFLIAAAFQPADFRITRSAAIAAPPAAIFENVNDLQKFLTWSPFAKMDPEAKYAFAGPPRGEGASLSWVGAQTGEGSMTITESRPNERILFQMDFRKPMASTATTEFTFVPEGDQTRVTWTMDGRKGYLQKAIGIVADMDRMLGGSFEQGLADLAKVSQPQASLEQAPRGE